jgi:hypothetical protein
MIHGQRCCEPGFISGVVKHRAWAQYPRYGTWVTTIAVVPSVKAARQMTLGNMAP